MFFTRYTLSLVQTCKPGELVAAQRFLGLPLCVSSDYLNLSCTQNIRVRFDFLFLLVSFHCDKFCKLVAQMICNSVEFQIGRCICYFFIQSSFFLYTVRVDFYFVFFDLQQGFFGCYIEAQYVCCCRHLIGFFLFLSLTIYTAMKIPKVVDLHSLQHFPDVLKNADLHKLQAELLSWHAGLSQHEYNGFATIPIDLAYHRTPHQLFARAVLSCQPH